MSWWGKLIGGTVGFILGGPLGALLGAAMGHSFDAQTGGTERLSYSGSGGSERIQTAFFTTTFSVMGHLAKADGAISRDEIATVESIMAHMQLNAQQRQAAINLFHSGKKTEFPLDAVLDQFLRECHRRADLIRMLVEMLVVTAMADGEITREERRILTAVCDRLEFPRNEFERLVRMVRANRAGRRGSDGNGRERLKAAYDALGLNPRASDEDVKKAYRRLLSEYHPDKLVSKGLPEEMMKFASEKTQEITTAYERIKEARQAR